jgi:hypothetical protein
MNSWPTVLAHDPSAAATPVTATFVTWPGTPSAIAAITVMRAPLRSSPRRIARTAARRSGDSPFTTCGTLKNV